MKSYTLTIQVLEEKINCISNEIRNSEDIVDKEKEKIKYNADILKDIEQTITLLEGCNKSYESNAK